MDKDTLEKLADRFKTLFRGLERAYGTYSIKAVTPDEKGKIQGQAFTRHAMVTTEIWFKHLAGTTGLGIVPITDANTVHWAAIDIDVYPLDLEALEQKLTALTLPLVVCRTKSGGAHLYLFLSEPVQASIIRKVLARWALAIGYPSAEIFPKQNTLANTKDVGNWINMPYFNVTDTKRHAIRNGIPLDYEEFLTFAESRKVTEKALLAFELAPMTAEEFNDGPPCIQFLAAQGFPRGNRNNGLFNLAVFARFAFDDDWKSKVEGYNLTYMEPPLSASEVMNVTKSADRKGYFYTCKRDPVLSVCNKGVCQTRKYGIGGSGKGGLSLMLGTLAKIDCQPPIWIADVEGFRIEVTTEELMNQSKFRRLCMDKLNKLPPPMKQEDWELIVSEKLLNVDIIEAPPDSGPEGQFLLHLENFCVARAAANTLDEVILGKPFHCVSADDTRLPAAAIGTTLFRSFDLLRYLDQQHFNDFQERQVWAALRRIGVEHYRVLIKSRSVPVWAIRSFRQQTEDFTIPPTGHGDLM